MPRAPETSVERWNFSAVSLNVLIRPETADDYAAIRNVNLAAFGSQVEATLVDRLRDDKPVIASLLAVDDAGHVLGHILFSPVTITSAGSHDVQIASLAPMSVAPLHQRKGIGSILIKHESRRADALTIAPSFWLAILATIRVSASRTPSSLG
jgi:predicted N-acetyltransferase YhbS